MKYVTKMKNGSYRFRPPADALKSGVVRERFFPTLAKAKKEVPHLLKTVDRFRTGEIPPKKLLSTNTLIQLSSHYSSTEHFLNLSSNSQLEYKKQIRTINNTEVRGSRVGEIKLKNFNGPICQEIYDTWIKTATVQRAYTYRIMLSALFRHALSLDVMKHNPILLMRVETPPPPQPTKDLWTVEQVETLLDKAFSEFKWRNVGLIVAMTYDWCQRTGDMRMLKWEQVNLTDRVVSIKQSSSKNEVHLPISDSMLAMLEQQQEDFGTQPYVAPYWRKYDSSWAPYTADRLSKVFTVIREEAGLPDNLKIDKLRNTGISEMVGKNVDFAAVQSVTGHKRLRSLDPYLKPRLDVAKAALDKRNS